MIESTGGLGLEYELLKDRLTVGADVFDFSRTRQPAAPFEGVRQL